MQHHGYPQTQEFRASVLARPIPRPNEPTVPAFHNPVAQPQMASTGVG